MEKKKLIIIGGGICGLVAATRLAERFEVIVLEALPGFGGRIRSIADPAFPQQVETGAEFVHGEARETLKLLHKAGLHCTEVSGKSYQWDGNKLDYKDAESRDWDTLIQKMRSVGEDQTLTHFLNTCFPGENFARLREEALKLANGFDLADPDRAGVRALYEEWSQQGHDYRVDGGYGQLIEYLVASCVQLGCKLVNNAAVQQVEWAKDFVVVFSGAGCYTAQKCLVTIPLGLLQKETIKFSPPLPVCRSEAEKIAFGHVVKVILCFSESFWPADGGFFFSDERIPTWWSQLPENNNVLTGWAGGISADDLFSLDSLQLQEVALQSLSVIFAVDLFVLRKNLIAFRSLNWQKEVYARGGYSYALPQSTGAKNWFRQSIAGTLHFAGEAFYTGPHPGTVEAAVVSGMQCAESC